MSRTVDGPRPHLPIDFFLRSLAAERGSHAIGVVLSGTASDGTEGLRAIKAENGITFAQDPESAKFGEMPRSAVDAGVVDYALAIPELAQELVRLSRHPYVAAAEVAARDRRRGACRSDLGGRAQTPSASTSASTSRRPSSGGWPAGWRSGARRDLQDYLALLQGDPDEVRALYEDILIHVTSFFRDPEVFEALESQILPDILKHKPDGAPIRVWVAGCSTGEEVYSLAISLLEFLGGFLAPRSDLRLRPQRADHRQGARRRVPRQLRCAT